MAWDRWARSSRAWRCARNWTPAQKVKILKTEALEARWPALYPSMAGSFRRPSRISLYGQEKYCALRAKFVVQPDAYNPEITDPVQVAKPQIFKARGQPFIELALDTKSIDEPCVGAAFLYA